MEQFAQLINQNQQFQLKYICRRKIMNFTFTWILDKFGFTPKIETFDFKPAVKKVAKKATKVAAKKTTRKVK